jgi:hypothetical protein
MNTLRVLARPRVWGPVLGIVAVLTLVFYAYLGAVVSPEEKVAARITSSDSRLRISCTGRC